jgi:hypothetical protein
MSPSAPGQVLKVNEEAGGLTPLLRALRAPFVPLTVRNREPPMARG